MAGDHKIKCEMRAKSLALVKRATVVSNIKSIHAFAVRVRNQSDLVPQILVAITD